MARTSLRDYQIHYKQDVNRFFESPDNKNCLMVMPTGTGKTTVFSSMTYDNLQSYTKTMICVHRKELVDQIVGRLLDFGIVAGVVAGEYEQRLDLPVQVCMVGSIPNGFEWVPDHIIIDECHHSTANSYVKLWNIFPRAKILGVTATPIRLDGKGFGSLYQTMIEIYKSSWFFDKGYLVRPKHLVCAGMGTVHMRNEDYDIVEVAKLLRSEKKIADVIQSYRAYSHGKQAVVFAVNVEHSKELAERFTRAGYLAAHLDGQMPKDERRRIINGFSSGQIKVLTNYDIISEGFDVPAIETVIFARRSLSLSYYIQAVGRCLRPAEGKTFGYVLDCSSQWLDHGFAGMDYTWSLDGTRDDIDESIVRASKLFYKSEGKLQTVIQGPEELSNVDLMEVDEKTKDLVTFDALLTKAINHRLDFKEAVFQYDDFLQFKGRKMNEFELSYCQQKLRDEGQYFTSGFWSSFN